jgi:hypothetical protein
VAKNALVWILTIAATVGIVVAATFALKRAGLLGDSTRPADAAVASDRHYLVFLTEIEVENGTASGGKWDTTKGGPDVQYDVSWRGNRVFQSSVRKDTLLARWDQDEIGVRDLLDGVSPERATKAARITARPGETIEFRVYDNDTLRDDEIGRWEVAVDSLRTGDQTWKTPSTGIRQASCRVVDLDAGR